MRVSTLSLVIVAMLIAAVVPYADAQETSGQEHHDRGDTHSG